MSAKPLQQRLTEQRERWALEDKAKLWQVPEHWRGHGEHHELGRELAYKAPNADAQKVFEAFAARLQFVEWELLKRREILALAGESADEVKRAMQTLAADSTALARWTFAANLATVRGVDAPRLQKKPTANDYTGAVARLECVLWWRRAYRVKVARLSEASKVRAFEVSKVAGQAYCSNTAVARRIEQTQANAAMLTNTYLSNGEGYVATLQELVDKSTASKPIRRGELMTRIRGCEDIAFDKKSTSLFFTLTCPSKYHPVTIDGKANTKYEGNTAKDGQAWLTDKWAKVRAKFKRQGIEVYGVRVAEPHHDNCPHWHVLLWCEAQHSEAVQGAITAAWLSEYGDERGAKEYRVKCELIKPRNADGTGGAAAYLAKYVAKNIDDYKTKEHRDEVGGEQLDIFGDGVVTPATRVEAWATHWGIRQFQTFGMPPVGVWRELRRLTHEDVAKSNDKRLMQAWIATQKVADKKADWAAYTMAQGGIGAAGSHRNCKIRLMRRMMEREGRYQVIIDKSPIGVRCGAARVMSNRKDWSAVSIEEAKEIKRAGKSGASRPRTCFNNCTHDTGYAFGGIVKIVQQYDSLEGAQHWKPWQRRQKQSS